MSRPQAKGVMKRRTIQPERMQNIRPKVNVVLRLVVYFTSTIIVMFVVPNSTFAQSYPPGTFSIAGVPFNCMNATTHITPGLGDLGRAVPGQGIWLNPILNSYPVGVIGFIFAHECAHFLGIMNEQEADSWAIQVGRNQDWINPGTVNEICQSVYFLPGTWTHFPGPLRCANMIDAFNR